MTLLGFIALYLIASIGIGIYAATRVEDYGGLRAGGTLAAAVCHRRHDVCDLVRFRDRARHSVKVRRGRVSQHGRRSVRRGPVSDPGRNVLRAQAVQDGSADDRRFLSAPLRPRCRDFQLDRDSDFVSRLGRRADHRARAGVQSAVGGWHQRAYGAWCSVRRSCSCTRCSAVCGRSR